MGSGALQIIEILLNLFTPNISTLNIVLLDEPDSHIHRDIQKRLLQVLATSIKQQQIFLTTHNEAMIRAAAPQHLFHIESVATKDYRPLSLESLPNKSELSKKGRSFSGAYPLATNAIMRAMGATSGLDLMNALEADKIIFVEGEDDAQAIYTLLQRAVIPAPTAKYVFWVLNGITNIKDLPAYKFMFQQIRNQKTLWEKSILVMDRDFIIDKHYLPDSSKANPKTIAAALSENLGIPVFMPSAYTFEATLFTNMAATTRLLQNWLKTQDIVAPDTLGDTLNTKYANAKSELTAKYKDNTANLAQTVQIYRALRDNVIFGKSSPIRENDVDLTVAYQLYIDSCLSSGDFYKLMKKDDVAEVINKTLKAEGLDIVFDIA